MLFLREERLASFRLSTYRRSSAAVGSSTVIIVARLRRELSSVPCPVLKSVLHGLYRSRFGLGEMEMRGAEAVVVGRSLAGIEAMSRSSKEDR